MTVRYVRYDSVGAGNLTGQVGSAVAILDTELVAAGWTIAFTATNKRVYRNSTVDGSGCYLRIDDTGSGTGGAREFSGECFATMSDIDTGTAGHGEEWVRKSSSLDTTARKWLIAADDQTVHMYIWDCGDTATFAGATTLFSAGDGDCPIDPDNPYRYYCIGRTVQNSNSGGTQNALALQQTNTGKSGCRAVDLDGISGAYDAVLYTPTSSSNLGNCGTGIETSVAASATPLGPVFLGKPAANSTKLHLRLRGLFMPLGRLWPTFSEGQEIAPGIVFTPARVDSTPDNNRVGALPIDVVGPW